MKRPRRLIATAGRAALTTACTFLTAWALGAIYFDGPYQSTGNAMLVGLWLAMLVLTTVHLRRNRGKRFVTWLALWLAVAVPWLGKRPSNAREWAAGFERAPDATVVGELVTFSNFRNFDYQPDGTPMPRWETRTVNLCNLRGMDFHLTHWGEAHFAHPIFSFDFGPEGHIAISIESRREEGETYSLLGGLYKRYELLYIVSNESDVIRHRTNFRKDENVHLYHLFVRPETAQVRFMEYVESIRRLNKQPEFYDVIIANCTTAIRRQITTPERDSMDWRIIVNSKLGELFYERGLLADDQPFADLKRRSYINLVARANPAPLGFSDRIREGLPGFE